MHDPLHDRVDQDRAQQEAADKKLEAERLAAKPMNRAERRAMARRLKRRS